MHGKHDWRERLIEDVQKRWCSPCLHQFFRPAGEPPCEVPHRLHWQHDDTHLCLVERVCEEVSSRPILAAHEFGIVKVLLKLGIQLPRCQCLSIEVDIFKGHNEQQQENIVRPNTFPCALTSPGGNKKFRVQCAPANTNTHTRTRAHNREPEYLGVAHPSTLPTWR